MSKWKSYIFEGNWNSEKKYKNTIKWSKNDQASSITCKKLVTNLEEKITMNRDLNTKQLFEAVSFLTFP